MGQASDHNLGGELRLRRAESPESTAGNVVRVDDSAFDRDMRNCVHAGGEKGGNFGDLGAGRSVGPAVSQDLCLDRRNTAFTRRAPATVDAEGMSLVVSEYRFLAAPDDADA